MLEFIVSLAILTFVANFIAVVVKYILRAKCFYFKQQYYLTSFCCPVKLLS